jgi:hypothetical protein
LASHSFARRSFGGNLTDVDGAGGDDEEHLVVAVEDVDVRRSVVGRVNVDGDTSEPREPWHGLNMSNA